MFGKDIFPLLQRIKDVSRWNKWALVERHFLEINFVSFNGQKNHVTIM